MQAPLALHRAWTESRYRLAVCLIGGLMAVSLAVRLILLILQQAFTRDGLLPVLSSLGFGEVLDGLSAFWLAVPLILYLTIVPERWFRHRVQRALVVGTSGLITFAILFVAVAEVFFFQEFNGRFNFVAVDYLMYPGEVMANIWESYPTGLILFLLALASAGISLLLRHLLRAAWCRPLTLRQRAVTTLLFLVTLTSLTLALPSSAHMSEDRALNEITSNGYLSFWRALVGSEAPYEGLYATRDPAAVFARLHRLLAESAAVPASFVPGTTQRHIQPLGPRRRLNVVVVLEESFGSEFIGALHPRVSSLTPGFDSLAGEGTLLTHAYSTGNRTIRALEATTSSLPPLPGVSIVRRPQSKGLFTLPELLRAHGYQTLFAYGGRALFDGMGSYLQANGVERVVDQDDFPDETFHTAWGVADEAIFDRALAEMDGLHATGKPFYTLILSVSNHRPYRFPEDHVTWDPKLRSRENAVRYADWALARFVRQAQAHPFFGDTLFVLMGDHGARVYGAAEIPLPSYEVPILFYAPGILPAIRVDTLASALDVPPTVLGILGMEYESKFFGHDVLHVSPSAGQALMTHNNEIALLRGSRIAVLGLHRTLQLFDVGTDGTFARAAAPDLAGRELMEDAIAFFSGADRSYRTGAYAMIEPSKGLLRAHEPLHLLDRGIAVERERHVQMDHRAEAGAAGRKAQAHADVL